MMLSPETQFYFLDWSKGYQKNEITLNWLAVLVAHLIVLNQMISLQLIKELEDMQLSKSNKSKIRTLST